MIGGNGPDIANPDMHGANIAFMVVSILSLLGLILSFFIKHNRQAEDEMDGKSQRNVRVKLQE
ncbi:hypothetical protein [Neobacillus rhizosphaerae]|uniref:hypothetical protein n=1 Tax=Neobacillus rhizosphaerae TaxID=2880965 RepID=UPI00200EE754|nr:hypothetical protein [Neobacillus rhizosphaerae]